MYNSTGNIITSDIYNLTQIHLSYLSTLASNVATQSWVQSQGFLTSGSSYLPLVGGTMTGCINLNTTMNLSTTYTGCRICLYNGDSVEYAFIMFQQHIK